MHIALIYENSTTLTSELNFVNALSLFSDNFLMLRVTHDSCEHDTLSRAAEEGLHDLEVACAAVLCNAVDGADQQLVCDDHAGECVCG